MFSEFRQDDRATVTAFVMSGVLAGGNAVGVRFTVKELAPLWGAGLRFALAAALLLLVVAAMRLGLPRGRALRGAVLFGMLNFAGAFGFAYYTLAHMQAGLASTLLALVPLATLLLAVVQRQERLRLSGIVGGTLALAGVAVVSSASPDGSVPLLAFLAGIAGVSCFAEAAVLARRYPSIHPVTMNAVGMAVGGIVLLAGSVLAGETLMLPRQAATWAALAYLVVLGSVVVFVLFLFVIRSWSASRAVYIDLLIPPVAVALSAWLDSEPVTAALLFGGALILIGVYVGALRPSGDASRVREPAPTFETFEGAAAG
ncbi:MAG: DMT family transporter [Nitriliruptorales bacterium]